MTKYESVKKSTEKELRKTDERTKLEELNEKISELQNCQYDTINNVIKEVNKRVRKTICQKGKISKSFWREIKQHKEDHLNSFKSK